MGTMSEGILGNLILAAARRLLPKDYKGSRDSAAVRAECVAR